MLTTAEVQAHAADPDLAASLASGNDVASAARLSELLTDIAPVPINRLAVWAAQTGVRAAVQDAADTPSHPLRAIALTAIDLLQGGMSQTFDSVAYADLLDTMQTGGLMTAEHRAALTAVATVPRHVSPNDVARAVRNDDGSSKL